MKKIPFTLESSGSDYGGHYYEGLISCGKRAALDREAKAARKLLPPSINDDAFGVGILYHAFMELYFSKQLSTPEELDLVDFRDAEVSSSARSEAQRLAGEYFMRFGQAIYGTVLFNEWLLPPAEATPAQRASIEAAVGIAPWTGRVDMGIKTNKFAMQALDSAGLKLPAIGKYLLDFKTSDSEDGALYDRQIWSHQYSAYLIAANAWAESKKEAPFLGLIVDMCIKTKSPRYKRWYVAPPTEVQINALRTRWLVAEAMAKLLPEVPNADAFNCFPRGRLCPHWISGACDRAYSPEQMSTARVRLSIID